MKNTHHIVDINIRFSDLDTLGHVNNVVYAKYIEEARASYYNEVIGVPVESLNVVVAELHIEYADEISYDQNVRVGVRVSELGRSSMPMKYEIRSVDPRSEITTVAATAETVQVNIDPATGEPTPIPEDWRSAIAKHENI